MKPADAKTLAARIVTLVGAGIMLTLTGAVLYLYAKFQTIFFVSFNFENFRPLFTPGPGRQLSLIFIAMIGAGTIALLIKSFARSCRLTCWIDALVDGFALVMIALLLRQPFAGLFAVHVPAKFLVWLRYSLAFTLFFIALMIAIDLVANVVRLGRKRLAK